MSRSLLLLNNHICSRTPLNSTQQLVLFQGSIFEELLFPEARKFPRQVSGGTEETPFRTVPPLLYSGLVLVPLLQGGLPVILKPTGPNDLKEETNGKESFGRLHSE